VRLGKQTQEAEGKFVVVNAELEIENARFKAKIEAIRGEIASVKAESKMYKGELFRIFF
jgi:hypothetical protein